MSKKLKHQRINGSETDKNLKRKSDDRLSSREVFFIRIIDTCQIIFAIKAKRKYRINKIRQITGEMFSITEFI